MVSLFGRGAELRATSRAVGDVREGASRVLFLQGEAGIGKSALLDEVLGRAVGDGFVVVRARAEELEVDRPFGVLLRATRGVGSPNTLARLRELTSSGDEGAVFLVYDLVEDLIASQAARSPVVFALDDAQWADTPTLRALTIMFRRLRDQRLLLLLAARPSPSREELLAVARAAGNQLVQVHLSPLDDEAVEQIVRARTGNSLGPRLRAHLAGAGGNPLYVSELLHALVDEGAIEVGTGVAEIEQPSLPPSIVVTILHRLASLPQRHLELVRVAAVLGGSFTSETLLTASGSESREEIASVLALLVRESIFELDEGRIRFRHDVFREALYEDLGETARRAMHRQIGQRLADAGAPPLDVARHLVRGAQRGDTAAATKILEAAADPALDPSVAAALIDHALEVHPQHQDRFALLSRRASLLAWTGRPRVASEILEKLIPHAPDVEARFVVIQQLAMASLMSGDASERERWRSEAIALAERLRLSREPRILLLAAQSLFWGGDPRAALSAATRAAELAAEDDSWGAVAANTQSWLLSILGRPGQALERSRFALQRPADGFREGMNRLHYSWALADADHLEEALASLTTSRRLAEEVGAYSLVVKVAGEEAQLRYELGQWDEVEVEADTVREICEELTIAPDVRAPELSLAWISYHRGDMQAAQRLATGTMTGLSHPAIFALLAVLAERQGDGVAAIERADTYVAALATAPFGRRLTQWLPLVCHVAVSVGERGTADRARSLADWYRSESDAPSAGLAALRCRIIVDADQGAAAEAIDVARASPRPIERAGALQEAAAVLGEQAAQWAKEAESIYREIGAWGHLPRQQRRDRPVAGWDALTTTEIEVVRLAAQGLTNRQIGQQLFISHRTVATHLMHAFDKTGLRSRVELAREAASHLPAVGRPRGG